MITKILAVATVVGPILAWAYATVEARARLDAALQRAAAQCETRVQDIGREIVRQTSLDIEAAVSAEASLEETPADPAALRALCRRDRYCRERGEMP